MGQNSKIEWTQHTFNPWRGCTKVSPGCANCYAETLSGRNPKTLGVWGPKGTRVVASEAMWREPGKWDAAAKAAGERHRVFCASLADVFEAWPGEVVAANGNPLWWCHGSLSNSPVPSAGLPAGCRMATLDDIRERLFGLIAETPHLDWLLLTKRPERWRRCWPLVPVPGHVRQNEGDGLRWADIPNVWLGTSAEDQQRADERIPHLLAAPAAVRFLSCEPLLGPVDLCRLPAGGAYELDVTRGRYKGTVTRDIVPTSRIDWVIAGGESGPGARPMHPDWARSLRDQCVAAGVAFHFKQWGEHLPNDHMTAAERFMASDAGKEWHTLQDGLSLGTYRVGKKAAGRLLDGRTWDQYPAGARA